MHVIVLIPAQRPMHLATYYVTSIIFVYIYTSTHFALLSEATLLLSHNSNSFTATYYYMISYTTVPIRGRGTNRTRLQRQLGVAGYIQNITLYMHNNLLPIFYTKS